LLRSSRRSGAFSGKTEVCCEQRDNSAGTCLFDEDNTATQAEWQISTRLASSIIMYRGLTDWLDQFPGARSFSRAVFISSRKVGYVSTEGRVFGSRSFCLYVGIPTRLKGTRQYFLRFCSGNLSRAAVRPRSYGAPAVVAAESCRAEAERRWTPGGETLPFRRCSSCLQFIQPVKNSFSLSISNEYIFDFQNVRASTPRAHLPLYCSALFT
jgi:hypothetical protein